MNSLLITRSLDVKNSSKQFLFWVIKEEHKTDSSILNSIKFFQLLMLHFG